METIKWDWVIINVLAFYLYDYYIAGFLKRKTSYRTVHLWMLVYFVMCVVADEYMSTVGTSKILVGAVFICAWIGTSFFGSMKKKVTTVISLYFLINAADCLIFIVLSIAGVKYPDDIYFSLDSRLAFSLAHLILTFAAFCAVLRLKNSRIKINDAVTFFAACLSCIFMFVFWIYGYRFFGVEQSETVQILLLALTTLMLILFFVCMLVILQRQAREKARRLLIKSSVRMYKENAESLYNQYKNIFELKSACKNALKKIMEDYKSDRSLDFDGSAVPEAEKNHTIYVAHGALNSIISSKARICVDKGIRLDTVIAPDLDTDIDEVDICGVVFNLMDNAIEASDRSKDRYIKLKLYTRGEYLVISTENPLPEGEKSAKPGDHGLGLRIIKKIAKKHGGTDLTVIKDGTYIHITTLMRK